MPYWGVVQAFLRKAKKQGNTILISSHVNTDPDGLAAAYALGWLFRAEGFTVKYCFPGLSSLSKKLIYKLNLEIPESVVMDVSAYSMAICDTSSDALLGPCKELLEKSGATLIIDHHAPGSLLERADYSISVQEPAASVIVAEILFESGQPPPSNIATLLLSGILYDTKRFQIASTATFRVATRLFSLGDYALAQNLLSEEMSRAERLARLKGASRAVILDVCGYLIAITRVSAYEASVARALVGLGADIAIVVGGSKREVRASVRASRNALESGINLDELLSRIKSLPGSGGGHAGAGGYNAEAPSRRKAGKMRGFLSMEILSETVRKIIEELC